MITNDDQNIQKEDSKNESLKIDNCDTPTFRGINNNEKPIKGLQKEIQPLMLYALSLSEKISMNEDNFSNQVIQNINLESKKENLISNNNIDLLTENKKIEDQNLNQNQNPLFNQAEVNLISQKFIKPYNKNYNIEYFNNNISQNDHNNEIFNDFQNKQDFAQNKPIEIQKFNNNEGNFDHFFKPNLKDYNELIRKPNELSSAG